MDAYPVFSDTRPESEPDMDLEIDKSMRSNYYMILYRQAF
jgi:hypothetical protein